MIVHFVDNDGIVYHHYLNFRLIIIITIVGKISDNAYMQTSSINLMNWKKKKKKILKRMRYHRIYLNYAFRWDDYKLLKITPPPPLFSPFIFIILELDYISNLHVMTFSQNQIKKTVIDIIFIIWRSACHCFNQNWATHAILNVV